jgi:hypothetical protein
VSRNSLKLADLIIRTCRDYGGSCKVCPFNKKGVCYDIIGDNKAAYYSEHELSNKIIDWISF